MIRSSSRAALRVTLTSIPMLILLAACPKQKASQSAEPPDPVLLASFDYAWARIAEVHPYEDMSGVDWDAVRDELRPKAAEARTRGRLREVVTEMLLRLGDSHYAVFPGEPDPEADFASDREPRRPGSMSKSAPDIENPTSIVGLPVSTGDDAPASNASTADGVSEEVPASEEAPVADADVGLGLQWFEDTALVTRVRPGSAAADAGLRPGWRLHSVSGRSPASMVARLPERLAEGSGAVLRASHTVLSALSGPPGTTVEVKAGSDDEGRAFTLERRSSGAVTTFGNFPPTEVRFEARMVHDRVGYIAFSIFMPSVAFGFQKAVGELRESGAAALVIDLRGNPGGLGAMVSGLSGWLVGDRDASLGVLKMRGAELEFKVNPRASQDRFAGPVVVVVDELSASTSELFAAGLQELGRATVVGRTSAGMALPSVMETLPSGDVLQLVTADLHTVSGERIEGRGVVPDVLVPLDPDALLRGDDPTLAAAVSHLVSNLSQESP